METSITTTPSPPTSPRVTFLHALALVLGFTGVFTLLGISVGLLGRHVLYDALPVIVRVGSILLIVFALRVSHLQLKYWQWGAGALAAAAITYWLARFEIDQAMRLASSILIALVVLASAPWDRLPLAVLAILTAGLSWLTSDSLITPLWRLIESAGVGLIVFFASHTDLFEREMRFDSTGRGGGVSYGRSLLVGIIFAAGWTPCVGPILAGILLLASQTQTVAQGALLLAAYSLGLGIPFLVAGALFSRLTAYLPRFYRHLPTISLISGLLLLLIGLLIFTGSLAQLAQYGAFLSLESMLGIESSEGITLVIAFLGGLLSFLSPCVLPLVPAFLGYLSGAALNRRSLAASQPSAA
jgi:cytochrome c-type biogenesis protein